MTDQSEPRKPRIVDKSGEPETSGDDPFEYFKLDGPERLRLLEEKIKERESYRFQLELVVLQREGNPDKSIKHDAAQEYCQCAECEIRRANEMIKGAEYSIRQLKALHAKLR